MIHTAIGVAHNLNDDRKDAGNTVRRAKANFAFPAIRCAIWRRGLKQHARQLVADSLHKRPCCNIAIAGTGVSNADECARCVVGKHQFTNAIKDKNSIARHIKQANKLI